MLTTSENVPFCRDCKYLVGIREREETSNLWKCDHPKNIKETGFDLVSGVKVNVRKLEFCSQQRESSIRFVLQNCGIEGVWFEQYIPPPLLFPAPLARPRRTTLSDVTAADL